MDFQNDNEEIPFGSCEQMCPPAEYQARKRQKRLSIFEMQSNTYKNLPVKEFSRSAAGKQTSLSDLRPTKVLAQTMDYLIEEIVDRTDQTWTVIYHFVFDRIRAIRQDMVIQRIVDESAVEILEKVIRFHIFAHYKLSDCSLDCFDPYINDSHLQECLKRLLVLYDNNVSSQNRAEFEGYYLLHNLGSHEAMHRILNLPKHIKEDELLKLSLKLSFMKLLGNFVAVFRIARKLSFLARCLVLKHSTSLRYNAVAIMNTAFSNPNCNFPLSLLSKVLAFRCEDTAKEFVSSFGIEVVGDYVKFSKKSYVEPVKYPACKCDFVDDELPCSIREILQRKTPLVTKSSHPTIISYFSKEQPDNGAVQEDSPCSATMISTETSCFSTKQPDNKAVQGDSMKSATLSSIDTSCLSKTLTGVVGNDDHCDRKKVQTAHGRGRGRGVRTSQAGQLETKEIKGRGRGRGGRKKYL